MAGTDRSVRVAGLVPSSSLQTSGDGGSYQNDCSTGGHLGTNRDSLGRLRPLGAGAAGELAGGRSSSGPTERGRSRTTRRHSAGRSMRPSGCTAAGGPGRGRARRWRWWSTTRRAGRPVREALPIVLGRLHAAGVRPEDITISVGVGRHHARGRPAMRKRRRGRGGGDVPLFQPTGGRPCGVCRPGGDAGGGAGAGLPPGGRGGPADLDRLGAAASPGGVRRRVQADLPGDESSLDARGTCTVKGWVRVSTPGGCSAATRRRTRCGGRSRRRRPAWALASRSATCSVRRGRSSRVRGWASRRRCRTGLRPRPGGGSQAPDAAGGRRGRRGQPPLAGRPDAELQGPAPAPRRVPAGRRPGRLLLDRAGGDRPLVPDAFAPGDRGHRRLRGLGDPPRPGAGWPGGLGPGQPRASS